MIKSKSIQALAMLLLFVTHAFSQERDLATVNYTISKLKYNDTAASARQYDIKLRLPLRQKNKSILGSTIGYKNVNLHSFPASYVSNLHGITLQGAWLYKITQRSSLTFFAQAGLFSDMSDISGKDFRLSGGFRYRLKHSDKLSTGWGLAYARQFFGNQIVPFIDVDYKPNEKWSISGQFPVKPKILYHFNKKLSAGTELNAEAASYRLSAAERNNQFIQINQWTGLLKLEYQFSKSWQLDFGFGKNFRQNYKLYDDASNTPWTIITIPVGNKPAPVQEINNNGLNARIGLSFKPF